MVLRIDCEEVAYPLNLYSGKQVMVAIDSSKTDTAIDVSDTSGNILNIIELDGQAVGTTEEDTLQLCWDSRRALKQIFGNATVVMGGIEDIITKKSDDEKLDDGRYSGGITHHLSRFKITAVFMSLIAFFQDEYNITLELINNWDWKVGVIPEEYRKRAYGKSSLAYFKAIGHKYANTNDNITDAICIKEFMCKKHNISRARKIEAPEACSRKHEIFMVSDALISQYTAVEFCVNEKCTIVQNAAVMANRIQNRGFAKARLAVSALSFGDIYKYCAGSFTAKTSFLWLLVQRME